MPKCHTSQIFLTIIFNRTLQDVRLSGREQEVLRSIAQGKTTKEVARDLKLSARTVETYRVRLKRKLNARNVTELLNHARTRQLV